MKRRELKGLFKLLRSNLMDDIEFQILGAFEKAGYALIFEHRLNPSEEISLVLYANKAILQNLGLAFAFDPNFILMFLESGCIPHIHAYDRLEVIFPSFDRDDPKRIAQSHNN
jgi:hypothetical protein